ncbi:hypothetical protein [Terracidiphilus gabretensis]|uniref:hypothetical protein n=1 Tax=Terracidiphilus gabretensis TaxID=1577687 RepID=UPI00071B169C|nr:hypothetical protein [Terracidiphilus gabretensis]
MLEAVEVEHGTTPEITADMIRTQLELLVRDEAFRSSKRSVAFLRYVVEQTLSGQSEQIKERSIGVEVFGKDPSYDTNIDHVVRTAATELRKRLATYYVDPKHHSELRMTLVPGSYIPRFTLPHPAATEETEPAVEKSSRHLDTPAEPESTRRSFRYVWVFAAIALIAAAAAISYMRFRANDAQNLFWHPILSTPGPILLAVGDHPNGPPTIPDADSSGTLPTPVPSSDASETVPFADTVTIARVASVLAAHNKQVIIRRESASSFSDLRQGAAVLIGAFNNEWSLRLTRQLRFSLAMDADKHLIYIRDAQNSASRTWSWGTNQPRTPVTGANSPSLQDYALISRIRDSETGHTVVVIGGLYTYGTLAAGEFLTDPALMQSIARESQLNPSAKNLQIVLGTTVTDGIPGPPRVLALSAE